MLRRRLLALFLMLIVAAQFAALVKAPQVSEGVQLIRADLVQAQGITGLGVKIAVIDTGFDMNIRSDSRVKNVVETKSFRIDGNIEGDSDSDRRHGTAVAEIISDVAPGAQLYLYNVGPTRFSESFVEAVKFATDRGVQIISASLGSDDPRDCLAYDGSSPISRSLEIARSRGVLPVIAAGNEAEKHWGGAYTDKDLDGLNDFQGSDLPNTLQIVSEVIPDSGFVVELSWNDWPSTDQDLNLMILNSNRRNATTSHITEADLNHKPLEIAAHFFPSDAAVGSTETFLVTIQGVRVSKPLNLNLFVEGNIGLRLSPTVAAGSIDCPADSRGAMTVGATPGTIIESFSSQGPTTDGRIKPDIVAPDRVSTSGLGFGPNTNTLEGFPGTSAAAPSAAGAAALLLEADSSLSPDQLQSLIESTATDMGESGKDSVFGAGRIDVWNAYTRIAQPSQATLTSVVTTVTTTQGAQAGLDLGTLSAILLGVLVPVVVLVPVISYFALRKRNRIVFRGGVPFCEEHQVPAVFDPILGRYRCPVE